MTKWGIVASCRHRSVICENCSALKCTYNAKILIHLYLEIPVHISPFTSYYFVSSCNVFIERADSHDLTPTLLRGRISCMSRAPARDGRSGPAACTTRHSELQKDRNYRIIGYITLHGIRVRRLGSRHERRYCRRRRSETSELREQCRTLKHPLSEFHSRARSAASSNSGNRRVSTARIMQQTAGRSRIWTSRSRTL